MFQETHSGLGTCISTLEPNVRLHPSDRGPAVASFALFGTNNLSALSAVPAQEIPQ